MGLIGDHLREIATDVRPFNIENSDHWVAEEQPEAVVDALHLAFFRQRRIP